MAAVGSEVGGFFLTSGVVSFFVVLLLLSIFLTALCSECSRRSFELQDSAANKDPSSLVRVMKLEDAMVARENPMIGEIQSDEKEFIPSEGSTASFTPWRSHLGAPQSHKDVQTNGSTAVMKTESDSETVAEEHSASFTPWRSHLNPDVHSSPPADHIYHTIGGGGGAGGGGGGAGGGTGGANQKPGEERSVRFESIDRNSVYARVSKKTRPTTPPPHTPEEVQEEVEASSPPLPDRKSQLEG